MTPMISIVGKSGSGKTTLIEKLIHELKQRGYRVGVIKHIYHKFEIDKRGKDSWRHMEAGADTVAVASSDKIAVFKAQANDDLNNFGKYFDDVDIVLTEGFKKEDKPKIEIFRAAVHETPLCLGDGTLTAIVTDDEVDTDLPTFALDEIGSLTDFITQAFIH